MELPGVSSERLAAILRGELPPPPEAQPADVAEASRDPANRFGRFVRLQELGRGGFGAVWKGWDTELGRPVAIKILSATEPEDLDRFRREARLAASLSHPAIAPVYEFGEKDGRPFLAMAFVDGVSADKLRPDAREATRIVRDAAQAVHAAHKAGVLHRDLKPSNLMVDREGRVFVLDFGIARRMGVESSISASGAAIGTPAFMSPEQARGRTDLGPAADVWGLGATLYDLLTGIPPFGGGSVPEVLLNVVGEEPIPVRRLRREVPRDLETIVRKCLDKDPARRYASAAALAEDLERFLAGDAIAARPPSWVYRASRRVRKNPWAWSVGAALCVAALVAVVWGAWAAARERSAGSRREEAQRLVFEAAQAWMAGRPEAAEAKAREALAKDPSEGRARFWVCRPRLREYEERRPLPAAEIVEGLVTVEPTPPEPAELRDLRAEIERLFREIGGGSDEERLAGAVLAIWDGEYGGAHDALARLADEAMFWADAAYYGALGLYLGERFVEARAAVEVLLPLAGTPAVAALLPRVALAAALDDQTHGREPPWADVLDRARALARHDEAQSRVLEAHALVAWGRAEEERGVDPEPWFDAALARVEGMETAEAYAVRGDALLARAEYRSGRGRVDPDDPQEYLAAIDEWSEALVRYPEDGALWIRRALGRWRLDGFLRRFGRPRPEVLGAARDDARRARQFGPYVLAWNVEAWDSYRRSAHVTADEEIDALKRQVAVVACAVEERPGWPVAYVWRATALGNLAVALERSGEDGAESFEAALADLSRAGDLDADYAEAIRERGTVRQNWAAGKIRSGVDAVFEFDEAIRDLAHAVEINPRSARGWMLLGVARQNRVSVRKPHDDPVVMLREALADFDRAIEMNPAESEALRCRGVCRQNLALEFYRSGEDPTETMALALADLEMAIGLNPRSWEARIERALVQINRVRTRIAQGSHADAACSAAWEDADAVIRSNPSLAAGYLHRGQVSGEVAKRLRRVDGDWSGPYDAAVEDLNRAQEIDPGDATIPLARGVLRADMSGGQGVSGLLSESITDFRLAISLNPRLGRAWCLLGQSLWGQAKAAMPSGEVAPPVPEEALECMNRAIELDPSDATAHLWRGRFLFRMRRLEEARVDLEEAIRLNPTVREQAEPGLQRIRQALGLEDW